MIQNSRALIAICILVIFANCKPIKESVNIPELIDRPIVFDENRKQLTLEYLENRYGIQQESPTIEPKMIVLHWTVIPTLEESFEAFNPSVLPNWRPDIKGVSGLNVSSQFIVDRDGAIYQLLPETTMARHVIGLNHCAIGIENVGGTDALPLTEAQLKSNIALVKYLANKYVIDYLIGHYEYTLFENHPLWLEKDKGYRTKKTDPGEDFMYKVRQATKNLNFEPLPKPITP
ncbi:N-acetylmuramoyl-L-alanine amidase [Zobellia uliginosa]|uniref:N-acetylmuramoyl-L-alanine amidase n=1 Tax=Zobellia uliginosa TaxID=143224 RepID=UPI001C068B7A|nr:peptidoglycan recognition family protein [Zobellia uliginosa]MBU2946439.1 peptidoglycan recognition protein family protein [Zobellia uliginosa]